ncbi:uncharacterized protein LOC130450085 [Diorhabda sublineata]|uniref:uncharacterized protein LOC130450085 n=1 Tax=Diorhabda sublineata TaxID=1163346 RepID=UPI0024E15A82|nr:uncharacterized protein LOC130450085 [Diorhabda sublineata]
MKVPILLCLVTVCVTLPTTGRRIGLKNGVITITSSNYQLSITRSKDIRKMDVFYENSDGTKGEFRINEPSKLRTVAGDEFLHEQSTNILGDDYAQYDIVENVFGRYEGAVDDVTYNEILDVIESFVQKKLLNENMLEILKHVESPEYMRELFKTDSIIPKIMVNDVVIPTKDGIARMRELSAVLSTGEAENVQGNNIGKFAVVPLRKDTSPRFIASQKYSSTEGVTPARYFMNSESNYPFSYGTDYNRFDSMMDGPRDMMYRRYTSPGYLQRYPEMYEQRRQSYVTPMSSFWEKVMGEPRYRYDFPEMQQRAVPRVWTYQYPITKRTGEFLLDEDNERMMISEMARQMMNQRMMEQRMMYQDMMEDVKYQPRSMFTMEEQRRAPIQYA